MRACVRAKQLCERYTAFVSSQFSVTSAPSAQPVSKYWSVYSNFGHFVIILLHYQRLCGFRIVVVIY